MSGLVHIHNAEQRRMSRRAYYLRREFWLRYQFGLSDLMDLCGKVLDPDA